MQIIHLYVGKQQRWIVPMLIADKALDKFALDESNFIAKNFEKKADQYSATTINTTAHIIIIMKNMVIPLPEFF